MRDTVGQRYPLNGTELNVVIEGDGPPVLLAHGFTLGDPEKHAKILIDPASRSALPNSPAECSGSARPTGSDNKSIR